MSELYTLQDCSTGRQASQRYALASADQILAAARHAIDIKMQRGASFASPQPVKDYLVMKLAGLEHEVFAVLFLDSKNQLIHYAELFRGSINSACIHPREVLKEALQHNAAGVIIAHNHPSGNPQPSTLDIDITQKLKTTLDLVEIAVLDHIIVAGQQTVSFVECGLL